MRRVSGWALVAAAIATGAAAPAATAATSGTITIGGTTYGSATHRVVATYGPTGVTLVATPRGVGPTVRFDLAPPLGATLGPGTYADLVRAGAQDVAHGGLLASVDGTPCASVAGTATVNRLRRAPAGRVAALRLSFGQACDGGPAVSGAIEYVDTTQPVARPHASTAQAFAGSWAALDGSLFLRSYTRVDGRVPVAMLERRAGGRTTRTRLPAPRGASTFAGGVDGEHVVWQVVRGAGSSATSRIAVAPLARVGGFRLFAPGPWAWQPLVDGVDVAFTRGEIGAPVRRIVLSSVDGRPERVIATSRGRTRLVLTTDLDDGRVVYDRCDPARCRVVIDRFRGVGPRRLVIDPPPGWPFIYSGVLAPDGSIWAVVSKKGCGASARIVRRSPAGDFEVVLPLGRNVDAGSLDVERVDGALQIGFLRYDCRRRASGSYYLETPEVLSPPAP